MSRNLSWNRDDVPAASYPITLHVPADRFNALIRIATNARLTVSEFAKRATLQAVDMVEAGADAPDKRPEKTPKFSAFEFAQIIDMARSGSAVAIIARNFDVRPKDVTAVLAAAAKRR